MRRLLARGGVAFRWSSMPRVIGHRGSPSEAPENTMASFRKALDAGAYAIELDVRMSADHELVVLHDAELGRTVAGVGVVEEMRAADLLSLDAGRGERVPTLRQVLGELPRSTLVDVEIKPDAMNAEQVPARVASLVTELGALERVLVTSFAPELADDYAQRTGRPAGIILPFPPSDDDLDAWPRLRHVMLAADAAVEECLALIHRSGRSVAVWTVNDAEEAASLLRAGADGIITDRPRTMAHLP